MKNKSVRMGLMLISVFILVGLACNFSVNADPTATPVVPTATPEPTQELVVVQPTPTNTVVVIEQPNPTATTEPIPTEAPVSSEPPAYFTEEFDGDLSSWSYFMMNGNESLMDLYTEDGRLIFDLQGTYQYVYVLYDEYTYPQVRIDLLAENRGKNTNNVSLVCNYSDRDGWYEFNISNGGLYDILVYSEIDEGYFTLDSGGSTNINMGRDTNVYTAICDENYLALYINGILEKEVVDNKYNLQEGQVGFSVSSFDVTPILVEVDYFSISQP